jgi:hypothetical protein
MLVLQCATLQASAAAPVNQAELIWTNPNPTSPNDMMYIYRSPGTATVAPSAVATESCLSITPVIWSIDGNGVRVWQLQVYINWCYDGTNVTYYYRQPQVAVGGNWADLGTVEDSTSYPVTGYWNTFQHHKHQFAQCEPSPYGPFCWGNVTPWVDATVYGWGDSTSSAGT